MAGVLPDDFPHCQHSLRGFSLKRMARMTSFGDFWLFYLREHSQPRTRALHYVGTSLVVLCLVAGIATGRTALFWAMPVAGYAFAWVAHFAVEKNRPATFTHPLWSLIADFRMWGLWLTGRLGPELERAGVTGSGTAGEN